MKAFKMVRRNGNIYILKYSVGLFGVQYESISQFTDKLDNVNLCKQIVKLLNQCKSNDR
jgi:hypothetical protein